MSLPAFRMTTARLIGIIALISVGLVPLSNPTRAWLGCLMYLKFSLVVTAAFLARYGRDRDWWFGFSVCGSAYILLCVPGLWNAVTYGGGNGEFNGFDLTGKAGELIASLKSDPEPGRVYNFGDDYASIVRFWITMAVSFGGGYLSLLIASRRRSEDAG